MARRSCSWCTGSTWGRRCHRFYAAPLPYGRAAGVPPRAFLTLVKLLVLGLGLSCFVMAYSLFTYWRSAEGAFAKADRTYIVTTRIRLSDGSDTGAIPRLDQNFFERLPPRSRISKRSRVRAPRALCRSRLAPKRRGCSFRMPTPPSSTCSSCRSRRAMRARRCGSRAVPCSARPRRCAVSHHGRRRPYVQLRGRRRPDGHGRDRNDPQPSHLGPSRSALLRFDVLASWDALERVTAARRAANGGFGQSYPQLAYAVLPEGSASTPESLAARLAPIGELEIERDLVRFTIGMLPIRNIVAKQLDSALFSRTAVPCRCRRFSCCSACSCSPSRA